MGGRWFNREGVTGRIRSRRRWLTVTSEGEYDSGPCFFFFLFSFSFLFLFARPLFWARRRPSRRVGGGKKRNIWISFRTHRRRYTPLSPNRLRPSSCQTAVSHAVRRTVSWAVGPGITDRIVCKPPDPSPFPYSCCHQASRHTYKSTSFALCSHQEIGDFHFLPPPSTILS